MAADIRALFTEYTSDGGHIDLDKALRDTLGMTEEAARVRADAITATAAMLKAESERNSKVPSIEMTQTDSGASMAMFTRLASYVGTVSGHLGRAFRSGAGPGMAHFAAYALSGYAYYKATQLARGKSIEEALTEGWEEDPHMEFIDMLTSVPMFGWAQMPLSWLFEQGVLRSVLGMDEAGSVQGGQTLSLASLSAINRMLKQITSIHTMDSTEDLLQALSSSGLPYGWVLGIASALTQDALIRAEKNDGRLDRISHADPDTRLMHILRQVVLDPEVSFELPEFGAQGISVPEDKRLAASVEMAQKQADIRRQAALAALPPAEPAAPVAATPAAPAAAPPANAGPLQGAKRLDAPDSLK